MENKVTVCVTLSILLPMFVAISTNFCIGLDGLLECCHGYKWNLAQNICIPCEKGFNGINCDIKCSYPTYGQDCQSLCDCIVTYCDHINGCMQTSEHQNQSDMHKNYRTVTNELMAMNNISRNESVLNISSDNTTNFNSPFCDTNKGQSRGINNLMFSIIGLAALSFIIYLLYLYTRVLEEKRQVNTIIV